MINSQKIDVNFNCGNLLSVASRFGKLELVNLLLDSNELRNNVDLKNNNGNALIWANSQGHLDVIKTLIKHGDKIENNIEEIFSSVAIGFSPMQKMMKTNILSYYVFDYKVDFELMKELVEPNSELEKMFAARSLEEKLNNDLNTKNNNAKLKI